MGVTTYPCPRCSQQQRQDHPNGEKVFKALCPACLEKYQAEEEKIVVGDGSKAQKEKAISALYKAYGLEEASKAESPEAL